MRRRLGGMACIVLLATGCAGPQLATSPVTAGEEAEASRAMRSEALPPELRTSGVAQVEMVRRVERRIRPATEKVCARTLDRETCRGQYRKITVHVKPEDDTINATAQGQKGLVGFLKTHPTDARRIAHWSATSRLIDAGQQRPESIESVEERQRQERLVAKCERLYREYPECPDWGKAGLPGFARLGRMTKGICPFPVPADCAGPE